MSPIVISATPAYTVPTARELEAQGDQATSATAMKTRSISGKTALKPPSPSGPCDTCALRW